MSLFDSPKTHAANPPESWEVVKRGERLWSLTANRGTEVQSFPTKRAAEVAKTEGFAFDLWHTESRWYAGEDIEGLRSYAECQAERVRYQLRSMNREQVSEVLSTLLRHYEIPGLIFQIDDFKSQAQTLELPESVAVKAWADAKPWGGHMIDEDWERVRQGLDAAAEALGVDA